MLGLICHACAMWFNKSTPCHLTCFFYVVNYIYIENYKFKVSRDFKCFIIYFKIF